MIITDKTIGQLAEELRKTNQEINAKKQKLNKLQTTISQRERRARTHRFCVIGGAIESDSILGRPLTEEDVPLVISFMVDQEARGHYVTNWIKYHSFF